MAAGDSPTSICNIALIALGEDPITSLADNTKRAILCNARYDQIRRSTLRAHSWNCAKKQAQIAAATVGPLFDWQSRYPLPADFIRFYRESNEQDLDIWDVMDGYIYTNTTGSLNCLYVYDLQDATKMDPLLVDSIAFDIAVELGLPLTQNSTRVEGAIAKLSGKLSSARMAGAQENAPREWDVDVLLRSRR